MLLLFAATGHLCCEILEIIDKMSKPKIARMFARKKPTGKGLNNVRTGRKEREAREALRSEGLASIDLDGMSGKPPGALELEDMDKDRKELLDGATAAAEKTGTKKKNRKGKGGPSESKNPKQVTDDYSHYTKDVAAVMRDQDKDLDRISDVLGDMKSMATAMNNEISYQSGLIDEVQNFTKETSERTKANARRVNKIK